MTDFHTWADELGLTERQKDEVATVIAAASRPPEAGERMTNERFEAWADEIGLAGEHRAPVLYVIDREFERGQAAGLVDRQLTAASLTDELVYAYFDQESPELTQRVSNAVEVWRSDQLK